MPLARAIEHLSAAENDLAAALRQLADMVGASRDLCEGAEQLGSQAEGRAEALRSWAERFPTAGGARPVALWQSLRDEIPRNGGVTSDPGLALLRDLRRVYLMAQECSLGWMMVESAALSSRERQLLDLVSAGRAAVSKAVRWIEEQIEQTSPEVLVGQRPRS
jgi:hypothetical protein